MTTPITSSAPVPIGFEGRMSGFVGLAIGNLLLTIVTFGIYRFWAKTKVRRHLWERTIYAGEPLEYLGRGLEKFLGALLVFAVVFVPLFAMVTIATVLFGKENVVGMGVVYLIFYIGLIYLYGVSIYRSQRYILSRTAWFGIRGGMHNGGWSYGWLSLKMLLLGLATLGLAAPYAQTRLWNARMNDAMFGSSEFAAEAQWRPVYRQFLFAWGSAIIIYIVMAAIILAQSSELLSVMKPGGAPPQDPMLMLSVIFKLYAVLLVVAIAVQLVTLRYQAAMLRQLFGSTRLAKLGFMFNATTGDLLRYYVTNILIIVLTLGFGIIVMPYRVWSFYVNHLSTVGELEINSLMQTSLAAPIQGDGLADAFDTSVF